MTNVTTPYMEGKSIHIRDRRMLALSLALMPSAFLFLLLLLPMDELLKGFAFGLGLIGTVLAIALACISISSGYIRQRGDAVEISMTRNGWAGTRWRLSDIRSVDFLPSELKLLFVVDNQGSFMNMFKGFRVPPASAQEAAGFVLYLRRKIGLAEDAKLDDWLLGRMRELFGKRALITRSLDEKQSEEKRWIGGLVSTGLHRSSHAASAGT